MTIEKKILLSLDEIKKKNRYRTLRAPAGIDLSSNDYLGLSSHPEILQALKEGIDLYGAGSTSSRLIRGHRDVFFEIESQFSKWIDSEDSLYLGNGFLANLGLLDLLGSSDSIFFLDRLCHASILDGTRLSGIETRYFKHMDMDHLDFLLQKYTGSKNAIVVTESVFSMDGDKVPLPELVQLKEKYGFTLVLDEAHALGIFGKKGSGITNSYLKSYSDFIDFRIFTAGKSLGLEGSFISCKKIYKEYLINSLRTFIFSTAPLPAILYAIGKSIDLVIGMDTIRQRIQAYSDFFREGLIQRNYFPGNSTSHIVPVLQENEIKTMELAAYLQEKGFDVRGIRPPTVKQSRLRINIGAKTEKIHLETVLQILEKFKYSNSMNDLS